MNKPQERIGTRRESHCLHQAFACLTTKRKSDQGEHVGESKSPMRVRNDHTWETFGEDFARTRWIEAKKTASRQMEPHRVAYPGQISEHARVLRVDLFRKARAKRTSRFLCDGLYRRNDDLSFHFQLKQMQTGASRATGLGQPSKSSFSIPRSKYTVKIP